MAEAEMMPEACHEFFDNQWSADIKLLITELEGIVKMD
jgi:hypothetical protein